MSKLEFLKDQVLVTKAIDPRTKRPALEQVVFERYVDKPTDAGDCVVRDQSDQYRIVNSDDLANIMWAEEVLAHHQRQAHGF